MTKEAKRNDPCPCGSGKKYKKCCGAKTGMQKYQTAVITSSSNALLGRISAAGSAFREKEEAKNDEKEVSNLAERKISTSNAEINKEKNPSQEKD